MFRNKTQTERTKQCYFFILLLHWNVVQEISVDL